MIHDIIGFCTFNEDNEVWYGCRGIGATYQEFYKWLRAKKLKNIREDWPWDYFVFNTPQDEEEFKTLFGNQWGICDENEYRQYG